MATKIVFNGREYASVEEMPEEMPEDVRKLYERAMGLVESGRGGLQLSIGASSGGAAGGDEAARLADRRGTRSSRWGEDERPGVRPGVAVLVLILLLVVAAALLL